MKYLLGVVAVILLGIGAFAVMHKVSPVSWGLWGTTNTDAGIALDGYDPVSYFSEPGPVKGSGEYTYGFADATWHFSSAANRDMFAADPERFAPQYGSFCAFAVSKGFTADSDPEAWYVGNDRLYVFADPGVRDQWVNALGEGSLDSANANWAKRN